MSRFFIAAACALSLMGSAAFAQSSMSTGTGSAMSSDSMTKPADAMKPAAMKPADSMAKPANNSGMSNNMSSGDSMSHPAQ